jgi:hypothetical protein
MLHGRHHVKGVCYQEVKCCCANPCEIAELIYKSQTACYGKDRAKAIDKLGDYDCQCNPEILCAMVYALNDADEKVRREAADEIGDVLRRNHCCCSPEVVSALTCALADCDRRVRHNAEQALKACGYKVVDGCCNKQQCCSTGCASHGCASGGCATAPMAPAPMTAPAPMAPAPSAAPAPAPAPPEDPKAYFPSRLRDQQTQDGVRQTNRLSNLFGSLN